MDRLAYLAIAVIPYLLGSISTGMLVSKAIGGPDLHKVGSGNTGATNALRTMGKKGGAIVKLMVLDIPKNSLNSTIFGGNCIRFACHCTDSSFRNVCRQN